MQTRQWLTALPLLISVSACSGVNGTGEASPTANDSVGQSSEEIAALDDFGALRDASLSIFQSRFFGFFGSVPNSTASIDAATAEADPTKLLSVPKSLHVHVVASNADLGANSDQMAFWPDDVHPTHLIAINEQGTGQAGVQRIRLSDGKVETILSGTTSGDPLRRTPWGTILAGEEGGTTGQMIEIIDPLGTTGVTYDRVTGIASGGVGSENVAPRWALGRLSFEGLAILPNGVVYYGDELAPSGGTHGGSLYKFVPEVPRTATGVISSLSESPLASGQVYGLKVTTSTNNGQGNETGLGSWVLVPGSNNANLRAASASLGLAGFYRPEDAEIDGTAFAAGNVRFCVNNTGKESARNYGQTVCVEDGSIADSATNTAAPEIQFFVLGNPELDMMDNIAQNPRTHVFALEEDSDSVDEGRNNDIWACLPDGPDFDLQSDGCVRFASLNDLTAESTGGIFDGTGRNYYVSIQHNITGHGVILRISGF